MATASYQSQYNAVETPSNPDTQLFLQRFAAALATEAYQILFVTVSPPAAAVTWAKSVVGNEIAMAQKYALLAATYPPINAVITTQAGWAGNVTDAELTTCAAALGAGVV